MTFQEVKELHEMGFTPEQIMQLNSGSDPQPEPNPDPQPEPNPDPQPEQNPDPRPEQKPESDSVSQKLESMEKKINDFIVAMQKNNIKNASVNILPDDQIDVNANTALSELIPQQKKKSES